MEEEEKKDEKINVKTDKCSLCAHEELTRAVQGWEGNVLFQGKHQPLPPASLQLSRTIKPGQCCPEQQGTKTSGFVLKSHRDSGLYSAPLEEVKRGVKFIGGGAGALRAEQPHLRV